MLLFYTFIGVEAVAQFALTGRVVLRDSREPVSYVSVSLTDADSKKVIGGGFTNGDGYFSIALREEMRTAMVTLTLSHLSYEKISLTDRCDRLLGKTHLIASRAEALKEVVVRPTVVRKRGDTIRYSVGQLLKLGDHTLEDAIKRIPGMTVGKNGQISYEGKSINKLYIEGLDLMGSKYALATKNIKATDVASVDVLENHEPVKMRKGRSLSDQAAINVRLKESAKNNWVYTVTTGIGANVEKDPLYLVDGSAYTFGKHSQTMIIGKGNNTGANILNELNTFALDEVYTGKHLSMGAKEDFFDTNVEMGDEVVRERGRINTTALGSLNYIRKLSEESKWRLNANYGFDRARRAANSTTLFRLSPTETSRIDDHISLLRKEHSGNVESNYTLNADRKHVKLQTELSFSHRELDADRSTNGSPYNEHTVAPALVFNNALSWSQKFGKDILTVSDLLAVNYLPQELTLLAGEHPLPDGTDRIFQKATTRELENELSIGYEHYAGALQLDTKAALTYQRRAVKTDLYFPQLADATPTKGEMLFTRLGLNLSPSLSYRYRNYRFTATPGVTFARTGAGEESRSRVWFAPKGAVSYQVSSLDGYLGVGLSHNEQSEMSHYLPYIFRGIGSIGRGTPEWWYDRSFYGLGRLTYKDIFNFFSIVYSASYTKQSTPMSLSTELKGIYRISTYEPLPQKAEMIGQSLEFQKIFHGAGLTTNLRIKHNYALGEAAQQHQLYKTNTQSIALSPTLDWQVRSGFSVKYEGELSRSLFRLQEESSYRAQNFHTHIVSMYIRPAKALTLNVRGTLFYNQSDAVNDGRAHTFHTFDGSAEWVLPWATVILSAKNIGSSSAYRIERQSSLNAFTSDYFLRPAEALLTFRWKLAGKRRELL